MVDEYERDDEPRGRQPQGLYASTERAAAAKSAMRAVAVSIRFPPPMIQPGSSDRQRMWRAFGVRLHFMDQPEQQIPPNRRMPGVVPQVAQLRRILAQVVELAPVAALPHGQVPAIVEQAAVRFGEIGRRGVAAVVARAAPGPLPCSCPGDGSCRRGRCDSHRRAADPRTSPLHSFMGEEVALKGISAMATASRSSVGSSLVEEHFQIGVLVLPSAFQRAGPSPLPGMFRHGSSGIPLPAMPEHTGGRTVNVRRRARSGARSAGSG